MRRLVAVDGRARAGVVDAPWVLLVHSAREGRARSRSGDGYVTGKQGVEVVGEGVDLGGVVSGGHGDPQSRCATWNGGGTDRLGVPAAFDELGAQGEGGLVAPEEHAEDRRAMVRDLEAARELFDVGPQASAPLFALGPVDQVDRPVELGGDDWRDARAKHEASRGPADPSASHGRGGDEGSCTAKCFSEGTDQSGRYDVVHTGVSGGATAPGEEAEGVSLVEIKAAVLGQVFVHSGRIGVVAVHGEQGLGHPPSKRAGSRVSRGQSDGWGSAVIEDSKFSAGEPEAVDEAGVVERVAEDLIARKYEGGQNSDVELEAARE